MLEVKVNFEELDLECVIEKAIQAKIKDTVTLEIRNLLKESKGEFEAVQDKITECIEKVVRETMKERIESYVNQMIQKGEVEGLTNVAVAKALTAYTKIVNQRRFEPCCGNCDYHEDFTGACANADSFNVADFTEKTYCCNAWKLRQGKK